MKRKILSVALIVVVWTLMGFASAYADVGESINNIKEYVKTGATALIALSAVITAILYMASSMNPGLKSKAKDALIALIVGIVILVLSDTIVEWFNDADQNIGG